MSLFNNGPSTMCQICEDKEADFICYTCVDPGLGEVNVYGGALMCENCKQTCHSKGMFLRHHTKSLQTEYKKELLQGRIRGFQVTTAENIHKKILNLNAGAAMLKTIGDLARNSVHSQLMEVYRFVTDALTVKEKDLNSEVEAKIRSIQEHVGVQRDKLKELSTNISTGCDDLLKDVWKENEDFVEKTLVAKLGLLEERAKIALSEDSESKLGPYVDVDRGLFDTEKFVDIKSFKIGQMKFHSPDLTQYTELQKQPVDYLANVKYSVPASFLSRSLLSARRAVLFLPHPFLVKQGKWIRHAIELYLVQGVELNKFPRLQDHELQTYHCNTVVAVKANFSEYPTYMRCTYSVPEFEEKNKGKKKFKEKPRDVFIHPVDHYELPLRSLQISKLHFYKLDPFMEKVQPMIVKVGFNGVDDTKNLVFPEISLNTKRKLQQLLENDSDMKVHLHKQLVMSEKDKIHPWAAQVFIGEDDLKDVLLQEEAEPDASKLCQDIRIQRGDSIPVVREVIGNALKKNENDSKSTGNPPATLEDSRSLATEVETTKTLPIPAKETPVDVKVSPVSLQHADQSSMCHTTSGQPLKVPPGDAVPSGPTLRDTEVMPELKRATGYNPTLKRDDGNPAISASMIPPSYAPSTTVEDSVAENSRNFSSVAGTNRDVGDVQPSELAHENDNQVHPASIFSNLKIIEDQYSSTGTKPESSSRSLAATEPDQAYIQATSQPDCNVDHGTLSHNYAVQSYNGARNTIPQSRCAANFTDSGPPSDVHLASRTYSHQRMPTCALPPGPGLASSAPTYMYPHPTPDMRQMMNSGIPAPPDQQLEVVTRLKYLFLIFYGEDSPYFLNCTGNQDLSDNARRTFAHLINTQRGMWSQIPLALTQQLLQAQVQRFPDLVREFYHFQVPMNIYNLQSYLGPGLQACVETYPQLKSVLPALEMSLRSSGGFYNPENSADSAASDAKPTVKESQDHFEEKPSWDNEIQFEAGRNCSGDWADTDNVDQPKEDTFTPPPALFENGDPSNVTRSNLRTLLLKIDNQDTKSYYHSDVTALKKSTSDGDLTQTYPPGNENSETVDPSLHSDGWGSWPEHDRSSPSSVSSSQSYRRHQDNNSHRNRRYDRQDRTCHNCGRRGHMRSCCPERNADNEDNWRRDRRDDNRRTTRGRSDPQRNSAW